MAMRVLPPGRPEFVDTFTPAILPDNDCSTFMEGLSISASLSTLPTDPVKSDFLCVPYPTTTTSLNRCTSSSNVNLQFVRPFTDTPFVTNPIKENVRTASSSETESEYLPSASVTVPLVVPFSRILTPGRGCCKSSRTTPETVWAKGKTGE